MILFPISKDEHLEKTRKEAVSYTHLDVYKRQEMGKVIDQTFIQSKMLNKSQGPAVHSLRAQADKANYSKTMRMVLENQENLEIKQAEVTDILDVYKRQVKEIVWVFQ